MNSKNTALYLIVILGLSLIVSSCRKEKLFTDSSAKVEFSKDTIVFDTVFVTIGSTYERFTVFNPYNNTIVLSQISLEKGTASSFRINVDGVAGAVIQDIEIEPKDSVYVFVEVTVDPTSGTKPFVIEDKINFTVNGNRQQVHLAAWGQDAYFHYNELVCDETWANDKPHVLYGVVAVGFPDLASNCTLTIPAGTEIYAHADAVLYVYESKLIVNGTKTDKVVFQGDRREASFAAEPGQWFGIRFAVARNSVIRHAVIYNATAGIYADTAYASDSISLYNVRSYNHSFASLFAQGARIHAENCEFGRAGVNSVALRIGGSYYFNHCTIRNNWTRSTRTSPALVLNDYYQSGSSIIPRPIQRCNFYNSIIYGSLDNELVRDTVPLNISNYYFDHCLIKTDSTADALEFNQKIFDQCANCLFNIPHSTRCITRWLFRR